MMKIELTGVMYVYSYYSEIIFDNGSAKKLRHSDYNIEIGDGVKVTSKSNAVEQYHYTKLSVVF